MQHDGCTRRGWRGFANWHVAGLVPTAACTMAGMAMGASTQCNQPVHVGCLHPRQQTCTLKNSPVNIKRHM
jgi:hypothetical protein